MRETQTIQAIDAWAQPVTGRTRQDLPEVVRLLEKSGTALYLDRQLTPPEIVAAMDGAGIQQLMLSAWCQPGRWLISNDEVAAHVEAFPGPLRRRGRRGSLAAGCRRARTGPRRPPTRFKALRIVP